MIIGTESGLNWMGKNGLPPFKEKLDPPLSLGNYVLVSVCLASLNSSIKTVKDIASKKISLGRKPQINWTVELEYILRSGLGLGGNQLQIQYVDPSEAKIALLDGLVDLYVVGCSINPITRKIVISPQTLELKASNRKIFH